MEILTSEEDHSVVVLDGRPEPYLALSSKTFFELMNLLDSCSGFVSGFVEKEEAVALATLIDRLNKIAEHYEQASDAHGYRLEVPKSQARRDYEKLTMEINALIEKLPNPTRP